MSAATARRNYGAGGSATQTMTAPHHHQPAPSHHHSQLYPTPLSSSTGTTVGSTSSRMAAQPRNYAYGTPTHPLKTAGESWSIQREGDKNVIVIEDTPPPVAGSSTAGPAKKARTNGHTANNAYQLNNLHYSGINPAAGTSSSAYAPSSYVAPVSQAKKAAPTAKRKFNEVNDPAAAVRLRSPLSLSCLRSID